jgi:hypothetical protein
MEATQHSTPLVRKLESILVLSEDEKDVLRNVSGTIKTVGPGKTSCARATARSSAA